MSDEPESIPVSAQPEDAFWKQIVLKYQKPSRWRAWWQILDTLVPYAGAWVR